MKLRLLYEKLFDRVFSLPVFNKLLEKLPFLKKLLGWEFVSYVICGLMTTAVNMFAYWAVNLIPGKDY